MTLKHIGYIELPENHGSGGFDHAEHDAFKITVGVIDVVDIGTMRRLEVVQTEAEAHTFALDRKRHKIYAFLPQSHRAAVFVDTI